MGGGGVQLFPGRGSNCLFPIESHITCDFQGGGPPVPPLDPRLTFSSFPTLLWYFSRCSAPPPPPPPPPTTIPRFAHTVQFYNFTYYVYVHLPFSRELEWKRIRLLAYQSCWLNSKRHPYILRNAHFTTRMRIRLYVSFFHGRRFLRYTGIQFRLPCTPRTIFHGFQIVYWD